MKLTPTHIESARRHLRAADPVMKAIIDAVGPYTLRFEPDRFAMLVRSIVSQQISTSAARAIRKRLQDLAGPEGLTAANLVRFTPEQLRSVGLSPQKAAYVTDLSAKVNDEGTSVSRYETDLLVYDALDQDAWIPRVVIECKLEGVTTHDAITYSRKASTHKQVHPSCGMAS